MNQRLFILIILFFLFALTSQAQRPKRKGTEPLMRGSGAVTKTADFTLEQFKGKWQEIKRVNGKGKSVSIDDTVYLTFKDGNKAETRDGSGSIMRGSAEIDTDNTLLVASDVYAIKSVTATEIVLDDEEEFIHTLKKVDRFWFESLGKDSIKTDEFRNPVTVKLSDITGKWIVYKRQAKPGVVSPPTKIITYLKVLDKIDEDKAKGEITFYVTPYKTESLPCTIKINNTSIDIAAGSNKWNLLVYKDDGKEFIFGDVDVLLYFAKPMP